MVVYTEDDADSLVARAFSAYQASAKRAGDQYDMPAFGCCDLEELNERQYIALRNNSKTLAVYRVRNDGILKRLKRIPKEFLYPMEGAE